MSAALKSRDATKKSMDRMVKFCKEATANNTTIEVLDERIRRTTSIYDEYEQLQGEIEQTTGDKEMPYQDTEHEDMETKYYFCFETLSTIRKQIIIHEGQQSSSRNITSNRNNDNTNNNDVIHLPAINLPVFSGAYTEWPAFCDLFTTTVANNEKLSNARKMQYLKTYVSGEAAKLIQTYQTTEAQYEEAWTTLKNRFDNKRFIIDAHLKSIFNQHSTTVESASSIKRMVDSTSEAVRSLTALGVPTQHWDVVLVFVMANRLDVETRRQWELTQKRDKLPEYKKLITFLEDRWQSLEMAEIQKNKSSNSNKTTKTTLINVIPENVTSLVQTSSSSCTVCSEAHPIYACPKFTSWDIEKRRNFIREKMLCFNCLAPKHSASHCKSKGRCRQCHGKHNTLLHNIQQSPSVTNEKAAANNSNEQQTINTLFSSNINEKTSQVLLSTALVNIDSCNGEPVLLRALLDSGSQCSFITQQAASKLGLPRKQGKIYINGLGSSKTGEASHMIQFILRSRVNRSFSISMQAYVIDKITTTLPHSNFDTSSWHHLTNLTLADPKYFEVSSVDLLIGADVFASLLLNGKIESEFGSPIAHNSSLGWILSGKIEQQLGVNMNTICMSNFHNTYETNSADNQLRKFWELEEMSQQPILTEEEQLCEQHFVQTHVRLANGRYQVNLPFRSNETTLGNSRRAAVSQFNQIERKLSSDCNTRSQYNKFMNEYLLLGHMQLISPADQQISDDKSFYLPHHAVFRNDNQKIRIVFNASRKTTTGIALNDKIMVGPTIQAELVDIILRWRFFSIVFCADIQKMYRQIRVASNDTNYQRIVWRSNPDEPLQDYRLLTVTYGTGCAPFLAIRSLRQLAYDEREHFPMASQATLTDFYVDDVMTGAHDLTTAIEKQQQLIAMLKSGGFELGKWLSNRDQLLQSIPEDRRECQFPLRICTDSVKTLGIHWHPKNDTFGFQVIIDNKTNPTKRSLLSEVSKLFDPLGWLAPVVVVGKIWFQKLWLLGLSWDEPLPSDICEHWLKYKNALPHLEKIKIPRWVNYDITSKIQIHGFSDASNAAYAAAVYVKVTHQHGTTITLLAAKTKVAPVRQVSLPRLELCGALLLSRLIKKVHASLQMPGIEIYTWTDSTVTLAWIRNHPSRWATFVANRVAEIQEITNISQWRYVPSKDNPADCASRGISPEKLIGHSLWWSGPDFLQRNSEEWPTIEASKLSTTLEMRKPKLISMLISNDVGLPILQAYSSLSKLKRITAYCLRYINNLRIVPSLRQVGFLTSSELKNALYYWVAYEQRRTYADELISLEINAQIDSRSKLLSLNPFICENGILRVGGRLQFAGGIAFETKHQIILSKHSYLTKLIVLHAHQQTLHGGTTIMMSYIRETFWIPDARNIIRRCIHTCHICNRFKAASREQLMGSLPKERTTPSRPFSASGVDYAGPIMTRSCTGRNFKSTKSYIALFICLATKAIHLEAVSDCSTMAFMAAFRRFSSRRGHISAMYSDNGTNFVGAKSELDKIFHQAVSSVIEEVASLLANESTNWHFIPPYSPNFGGLWEAGVKSTKHHLRRIVGNNVLTFEELSTLLAQIESILNSRPLYPLTSDPNDLSALTPAHFLMGESSTVVIEPSLLDIKMNRLSRWQLVQYLMQSFWKRWSNEYLTRLQQRPKWCTSKPNLEVGNLVLVKDLNVVPTKWPLARVIETQPGADGLTRVVKLWCGGKEIKRSIGKISLLPIIDNEVEEPSVLQGGHDVGAQH